MAMAIVPAKPRDFEPVSGLVVDIEEGVRLLGSLGGFSNYTGFGLGLLF